MPAPWSSLVLWPLRLSVSAHTSGATLLRVGIARNKPVSPTIPIQMNRARRNGAVCYTCGPNWGASSGSNRRGKEGNRASLDAQAQNVSRLGAPAWQKSLSGRHNRANGSTQPANAVQNCSRRNPRLRTRSKHCTFTYRHPCA